MTDDDFWSMDEDIWRCRKHPSFPRTGVCPICLRDRLLRLCSDCAKPHPCGCSASSTSSSSTTTTTTTTTNSSFSISTFFPPEPAGVGAVDRVSRLIESEPAFRRSRSTAFHRILPRLEDAKGAASVWRWMKGKKTEQVEEKEKRAEEVAAAVRLYRSRSIGAAWPLPPPVPPRYSHSSAAVGVSGWKGWNWYFPSPMKAFGYRTKAARVVHQQSPLCLG